MPSVLLEDMLETPGIRFAALVSGSGEVIAEQGLPTDLSLVGSARAIVSSLQQAVQAGDFQDVLIELESGPVLFTPSGENTLVAGFDEVSNLGRVRFAAKRVLNKLK